MTTKLMTLRTLTLLLGLCAVSATAGCRGAISEEPPLHPVLDMDNQQKIKAQSAFSFWSDGRGMRPQVEGTVWRGQLDMESQDVWKDAAGNYVDNPLPATLANLERGRERYEIHCAVCHDRTGAGNGIVLKRAGIAFATPPHLATFERAGEVDALLQGQKDGHYYEVIRNGKGTMPAYGHQVPVRDRWLIVHYLRALQHRVN